MSNPIELEDIKINPANAGLGFGICIRGLILDHERSESSIMLKEAKLLFSLPGFKFFFYLIIG